MDQELMKAIELAEEAGLGEVGISTVNDGREVIFSLRTFLQNINYMSAVAAQRKAMSESTVPMERDYDIITGTQFWIKEEEVDDEGIIYYENKKEIEDLYSEAMEVEEVDENTPHAQFDILTDSYYLVYKNEDRYKQALFIRITKDTIYLDTPIPRDEQAPAKVGEFLKNYTFQKEYEKAPVYVSPPLGH